MKNLENTKQNNKNQVVRWPEEETNELLKITKTLEKAHSHFGPTQ